ncbi:F0F1 ATP synthase subunit epsilon [Paucilactobacillus wasatchensis]|uniref:ATP synthase epsilon chain n=1 Tax=Paucilactobacillus wasatchensis TaxID=1335616 RepID=A0A0D0YYF2_9LACO|nr:F0F1 ATP synthase subunit epsilon [Paucilactobacillus wasatchensis]KIS04244.1 ATP synthase F1 sector epsilon chain [Paucilactobacillus wasatchensis]
MADHTFNISIVTPDGTVYDSDATMIIFKTQNGEMGILANHIPVLASLLIDVVRVKNGNSEDKIAVNGGFIEFSNNSATIVADSAEPATKIDVARAQKAKTRAEEHIQHAHEVNDKDELSRAEVALKRAANRLRVSQK